MSLVAISGSQGSGKAQPVNRSVLTPTGWVQLGDICVGDKVITPTGKLSTIQGKYHQGIKDVYDVIFEDGAQTQCCEEHLWKVFYRKTCTHKDQTTNKWKPTSFIHTDVLSLKDIKERFFDNPLFYDKVYIPITTGEYDINESVELPINPYVLGVLLGDGHLPKMEHKQKSSPIQFTSSDPELIERVNKNLHEQYHMHNVQRGTYAYTLSGKIGCTNIYKNTLKNLGLMGKCSYQKFVPKQFINTTYSNRLELLRGLLDTDGTVDTRGHASFTSTSKQLAHDVQHLVWSLGGRATLSNYKKTSKYRISYDVRITHPNPSLLFSLSRKKNKCHTGYYNGHKDGNVFLKRRFSEIKYAGQSECVCIKLDDPNQLYITDDFIVTHNTTILEQINSHSFPKVSRKTSRSILSEWGVTLQEVNNNSDLTIQFQEEIINRKHEDEIDKANDRKHTWFTERTFADLFTYAVVALGKDNNYSSWLNEYYKKCMRYNQIYNQVYYLRAGHFTPEHDGTRGSNVHYSRMVDLTMLDITKQMTHNSKLTVIEAPDLEQRVTIITEQTKALL